MTCISTYRTLIVKVYHPLPGFVILTIYILLKLVQIVTTSWKETIQSYKRYLKDTKVCNCIALIC